MSEKINDETQIIPTNIINFLNGSSHVVGAFEDEFFNINVFREIRDNKIESPIEQTLYIALRALSHINGLCNAGLFEIQGEKYALGIDISPQFKVHKYRVDFFIRYYSFSFKKGRKQREENLIVECDSQQFHERTEKERRYEKCRDRYFAMHGYKVFHYTGKEIVKNPYKVAQEILVEVTEYEIFLPDKFNEK